MNQISIVIPVYNVEDYLQYSVGSLRKQTYKNVEIILETMVRRIVLEKFVTNMLEKMTELKFCILKMADNLGLEI